MRIHEAASNGDITTVRLLISQGVDINETDHKGLTALHYASLRGKHEVVRLLLESGADININDQYNGTVLQSAVIGATSHQNTEVVHMLLQAGINIYAVDDKGFTALDYALYQTNHPLIKVLLSYCGSNFSTDFIDTLSLSGYKEYEEATKLVRQSGVRSLHDLVKAGDTKSLRKALPDVIDVDIKDKDGKSALMWAVEMNNLEAANILLQYKAGIDASTSSGGNCLAVAAKKGYTRLVALLLQHGADPNRTDNYGYTAFMQAAMRRQQRVITMLRESGANVRLAESAAINDVNTIINLLANGADINETNEAGMTPLMSAVQCGQIDATLELLRRGSNANIVSRKGHTALKSAVNCRFPDDAKIVAGMLLERGADINIRDSNERTPLNWAAWINNIALAKLLISWHADVNSKDNIEARTPLLWAIDAGNIHIISLLLENGADVSITDANGDNAIKLAQRKGNSVVLTLLGRATN